MYFFKKCEQYWPQPGGATTRVREEEEEGKKEQRDEEEEEEDERSRFGRFVLRVRDSREKGGFTVTDMEIRVKSL